MWTVKAYVEHAGTDVLFDWYESHLGKDKVKLWAKYYTIWLYLRHQPWNGWVGAYYHPLKGKDGVGRLGFDHKRVAYRHLGFRSGESEFTILLCAEEHDWEYEPKGCIDDAVSRMKLLKMNPSSSRIATIRTGNKHA